MAVTSRLQCGKCLGTYTDVGNGAEWIWCGYSQWIHDECTDVTFTDKDGNEDYVQVVLYKN